MKYTVLCVYGPERHEYKIINYTSNKMPNDMKRDLALELYYIKNNRGQYPKLEIIGVN